MLRKQLRKAVNGAQRSFHSSTAVHRVVATNPVKAQEVSVRPRALLPYCERALNVEMHTVMVVWKVPTY